MNLGDNSEYQRENNSEEVNHKPEENNSESEDQKPNYEYVDEDGNPIDPSEMEEYEVVDEEDDEESSEEESEQQDNNSQDQALSA